MELSFVEIGEEKIYFYIQRKRIKNMYLKVNKNSDVTVTMPKRLAPNVAKEFVKQKSNWIKKQLKKYNEIAERKELLTFENGGKVYLLGKQYEIKIIGNTTNNIQIVDKYFEIHIKEKYINEKSYIKNFYEKWLKDYSLDIYRQLVLNYQKSLSKYGIGVPEIKIRKMKSKWGCCIPLKNRVIFNLSLIKAPLSCVEYVVLHELSHFRYQNHSKNFYNFISIFMPDWKFRRKCLNDFGQIE